MKNGAHPFAHQVSNRSESVTAFAATIASDTARWAKVVQATGFKALD